MRLVQLISMLLAVAAGAVAQADPLRNPSQFGVAMRAGPGQQFPLIHVLDPGEVADRGRCDLGGAWCLLTAGRKIGWVDVSSVVAPAGGSVSDLARSDPIRPLRTAPVESTTLAPTAARPLPGAITEAVRGATDGATDGGGTAITPPGARVPFMFATDAPFYNVTEGLVNLRAGPGTDYPILGELPPGRGGTIDICDAAQRWCRMRVEGGPVAWTKMTLVGLRRIDVPPLGPGDVAAR